MINNEINRGISYLWGYLVGDGTIKRYNYDGRIMYVVGITCKKKDDLNILNNLFIDNFNISGKIYKNINKKRNYVFFRLMFRNKKLYEYFSERGNFETRNWNVPREIKEGSRELKASFIAGFFDAEGSVCNLSNYYLKKNGKRIKIEFTLRLVNSINKDGMREIQELFKSFNIVVNLINEKYSSKYSTEKKDVFSLNIYKKEHHRLFVKYIPTLFKTEKGIG